MPRPTSEPRRLVRAMLPASLFVPTPLPHPRLTFRLLQPADIGPLHAACYTDRPFLAFLEVCRRALTGLSQGRCYPLVAVQDGELVGQAQLVIYPSAAEIANLAVAPTWQGQGIGTALIAVLTQIARYTGQSVLEIGAHESNQRALALYQRLGFTISREIKLSPNGDKGIILERFLWEQL